MGKKTVYLLMSASVVIWSLDFVIAKVALETLGTLPLMFYKYLISAALMFLIWMAKERGSFIRKKDIVLLVVTVLFGEILYMYSEFTAMDFMPLSLISIIIAFVPAVSIMVEKALYKRRPGRKTIIGIIVCIFGVALIIGIDWQVLLQGRLIGYLLTFFCVLSWNIYNFVTVSLHERYTSLTLTFNQLLCTALILLPFALRTSQPLTDFTPALFGGILYLGALSSGICFLIAVKSLQVLGPTTTALFSNFIPIGVTFFGWLILGETIAPLQLVGGVIVIASGYVVIKEMGRRRAALEEKAAP
jgi:drug/metabolite transporter (DMT)-like permease